ncbi:MAG: response regulator [Sulfurimonas sp.]|nr:response regulator [Sulfurimonas sp.]MDQ7061658.1 response regulator [Sulfurimonas sp.]
MGKILIVDDSSLIRSVASSAALEAGHEAIVAEDGQKGLEALNAQKIDLIFSDVNMPVMGGLEMVEKIKQNDAYKYIPIIMLTTESNEALKAKGQELGVKAWMLKPFNKKKFFMAVKKLMA